MHTQTQTRVLAHMELGIKESDTYLRERREGWQEKVWRSDQIKVLECYSNGMGVVLGTYKRAERMIIQPARERCCGHA